MGSRQQNIIWLAILGGLSGLVLWSSSCSQPKGGIFSDVLVGIISSIALLLLIEFRDWLRDHRTYGRLAGKYERIEISEVDHTKFVDTKYKSMTAGYKDVNPTIELIYRGERRYTFEADYEQGKVTAVLYLDSTDPTQGVGRYQYTVLKDECVSPDIGEYKLIVDELDENKIYLRHKNFLPSGLAEGYEVLQRIGSERHTNARSV